MASSTSSGSTSNMNQSSESGDLQALMDQRKRKRMISNRESARRSRMRKQKHLDDLTAQIAQLRKDNHQIMTRVGVTTQHYVTVEAENSVLRAQVGELSHRLEALDEIIRLAGLIIGPDHYSEPIESFFITNNSNNNNTNNNNNPLSSSYMNHPIMASPDIFQY